MACWDETGFYHIARFILIVLPGIGLRYYCRILTVAKSYNLCVKKISLYWLFVEVSMILLLLLRQLLRHILHQLSSRGTGQEATHIVSDWAEQTLMDTRSAHIWNRQSPCPEHIKPRKVPATQDG